MSDWLFAHPVLVGLLGSLAAIAAALALLEWERVREMRPGHVPLYMQDWFRR